MQDNVIQIKNRKDIFKLGLIDEEGKKIVDKNGNEVFLEFDLSDVELSLKYKKSIDLMNRAKRNLKMQFIMIDKKKDNKRRNMISTNEEAKVKAIKQFYKDMEEAMDLFLGKGGTQKYLNGRNYYWEVFDDIVESLEPHLSKMKMTANKMTERIKEKYKVTESEVLKDE